MCRAMWFGEWHQPVGMLIETTPVEEVLHNDIYDFKPLARSHNGQVVLLGDAVRATAPNIGQGACQAMESAVVLARCLAQQGELTRGLGLLFIASRYGLARWKMSANCCGCRPHLAGARPGCRDQ